jgi:hypothetical protein
MAAGIAAALALIGVGFVAGQRLAPAPDAPVAAPPLPSPVATPVAVVPAALERADLLKLAAQAADAFTSNTPMPTSVTNAAGRRFDLLLPFGCEAADQLESSGAMRWSFDPTASRLKVVVNPITWRAEQAGLAESPRQAAELRGFWIERPWSSATNCSVQMPDDDASEALSFEPNRTVAIARVASGNDGAKIRPYEVVQRVAAGDFDPQRGLQLRIVGRTAAESEEGPVRCLQPGGAEQRPVCFVIGTFSEVRIENPKGSAVLASWPIDDDVRGEDSVGSPKAVTGPL